jgi:hypothetical protein
VAGYIRVEIFDDQNENGIREPNEPPPGWGDACVRTPRDVNQGRKSADVDGTMTFGPYPAGQYLVMGQASTDDYLKPYEEWWTQLIGVEIVNSGIEAVSMPLDVVTIDEEVIHPGEKGDPVQFTVCSADASWRVDRALTAERIATTYTGIQIDGPTLARDADVGSPLASTSWAYVMGLPPGSSDGCPPRDDLDSSKILLALISLAPVDVQRSGKVLQLRVRDAESGYTFLTIPTHSEPESLKNVLVVDEQFDPLYRCMDLFCGSVQTPDQVR